MVELRNVSASYIPGVVRTVRDISFRLEKGESAALLGANGAGKTALLLAIVGILPLETGSIVLEAPSENRETPPETLEITPEKKDQKLLEELRRRVGLVFQNPEDQLFMPSIYDDLAFGPRNIGLSEEETARRVETTLDALGIGSLRDRQSLRLSGGEKRMAAIAAVLTMEPDILLFDEPGVFLDPKARRDLIKLTRDLPQTKIIATHDFALARELCSTVLILQDGALLAQGTVELLDDKKLLEQAFFR
jgi:cobalt/nickel transport system ATP-binding protein